MFAAILALALADPHQAAQNAEVEMLKCFYGQAAVLDDRVSDATSIAKAVVSVCHKQFDDWKFANFAELRPPSAQLFYRRLEQTAASVAAEVVLRLRVASKR